MKKIISSLLLIVMVISMLPITAHASTYENIKIGNGKYSEANKTFVDDKGNIIAIMSDEQYTSGLITYGKIVNTGWLATPRWQKDSDVDNVTFLNFISTFLTDYTTTNKDSDILTNLSLLTIKNVNYTFIEDFTYDYTAQKTIEIVAEDLYTTITTDSKNKKLEVDVNKIDQGMSWLTAAGIRIETYTPYVSALEGATTWTGSQKYAELAAFIRAAFGAKTEEEITNEVNSNKEDWKKSLKDKSPTDTASFLDWVKAEQMKYAGMSPNSSFDTLVTGGLSPEQVLEISAISHLPGSEVAEDKRFPLATWINGGPKNVIAEDSYESYLEEFKEALFSSTDNESMEARIGTFTPRIKYLLNLCQVADVAVDTDLETFLYNGQTTQLFYPEIAYVTSPNLKYVDNPEAYVALVGTVMEMSYYSTILVDTLGNAIKGGTYQTLKAQLIQISNIKAGLEYLNSPEAWAIWAKEYSDVDSEFNSLEKIYNELQSKSAFEGLTGYDVESVGKPFAALFDMNTSSFSKLYLEGVAISSTYVPMSTNIYDPINMKSASDEFVTKMYYDFGFHRKALYIDTNVDSAVDYYRTGRTGSLRVATLEDLTYADKDICLYLDDNFYNANQLADLQGKAMNRLDNVDSESTTNDWWAELWEKAKDIFDMDIYEIAKTSEKIKYSTRLANGVDAYNENESIDDTSTNGFNGFLMSSSQIHSYLDLDSEDAQEYSIMQSFAVLSGVYKDKDLFNLLNTYLSTTTPVFMSSPTLPCIPEADASAKKSIYNYMLLKNLEANTPVGYETNMDMTSPLYMDIFGNILTESGLVVIPAASNATLHTSGYSPFNAGLLSTYGDEYKLTEDYSSLTTTIGDFFELVDGQFELKQVKTASNELNTALLSVGDKDTLNELQALYSYDLEAGVLKFTTVVNNIVEVLRGAPIEYIDKDFEGLNTVRRLDKNGLVAASKLEELIDAIGQKDINTTIKLPNLAFIEGAEYVAMFAFKIILLIIMIIWMLTIYLDAVGGQFSWRTITKCIGILSLVLVLIIIVPAVFDVTYYESNKWLLQDEVSYIQMLNLEKKESGSEIGISSIEAPDDSTKLYLKLDTIDRHWYDLFDNVMTASTFDTLENVYTEYNNSFISEMDGIETINDGVYISTDTLFQSSTVNFNPVSQNIYQSAETSTAGSYYTPYYAFLDAIVTRINIYNNTNNVFAYSTKIQRGGRVKTLGLIAPYFKSEQFMDGNIDVAGLNEIYGIVSPDEGNAEIFSSDSIALMQESQWCNMEISLEQRQKRIDKLLTFAKKYINENKELIGKVSDETFLKSMALAMALEHNKLFNTQHADALEIYSISNEDLMRMSIAPKNYVMKNSPLSYARFVYEVGGTTAVYTAALYSMITFASSWICPFATIAVFLITFFSIFIYKIVLRRKSKNLYGYMTTVLMICGMNILHAILLKLSMYLPNLGLTPTVCIIFQIIIQIVYLTLLIKIVMIALKDWRNIGYTKHASGYDRLTSMFHKEYTPVDARRHRDGWEYYQLLLDKQEARTGGKTYQIGVANEK